LEIEQGNGPGVVPEGIGFDSRINNEALRRLNILRREVKAF
jgi:hypothetical protein